MADLMQSVHIFGCCRDTTPRLVIDLEASPQSAPAQCLTKTVGPDVDKHAGVETKSPLSAPAQGSTETVGPEVDQHAVVETTSLLSAPAQPSTKTVIPEVESHGETLPDSLEHRRATRGPEVPRGGRAVTYGSGSDTVTVYWDAGWVGDYPGDPNWAGSAYMGQHRGCHIDPLTGKKRVFFARKARDDWELVSKGRYGQRDRKQGNVNLYPRA